GSYFVSNYPPFSVWSRDQVPAAEAALDRAATTDVPLGLYLHIPFCRKRCKFCYFRVYTDKNADDVETYLDALAREIALYADRPGLGGRQFEFVYFGGGTPSFISSKQLRSLIERISKHWSWDRAREVTFECEPGTLSEPKLHTLRDLGITRLSLGVENFGDEILAENGRAHLSAEVYKSWDWITAVDFPNVNIDLISGMVGETWDRWRDTVRKAIDLGPDSLTVYQMELPFNTVYSQDALGGSGIAVADWDTKRAWHDWAFDQFEQNGYEVSSSYTVLKKTSKARFVYRDSLWHGADLLGIGVSSFSHIGGVHYQNQTRWDAYLDATESGALPIHRAFTPSEDERLTREMILQMKLGHIDASYFKDKFGVDVTERFGEAFARLERRSMLDLHDGGATLTRQGLLRVDTLLPEFYDERYQNARYT
ncbi:MAG: coproporphyrinogen III oxidase family protein, partial [Acidobacteria bacterium]|nr:coproporphyrinogen III oxidase family protein [Acidobacteriota bacterium]